MKKYLTSRNLLIAMIIFFAVVVAMVIYRLVQFKHKDVKVYIDESASAYADKETAAKLIEDGVDHILASHSYSQQVLRTAKANKTPKEQELVHAAVMQCISFGYLTA